jgi:hypothetical protein
MSNQKKFSYINEMCAVCVCIKSCVTQPNATRLMSMIRVLWVSWTGCSHKQTHHRGHARGAHLRDAAAPFLRWSLPYERASWYATKKVDTELRYAYAIGVKRAVMEQA